MPASSVMIERVPAEDTHDLRRRVLRDGRADAVVEFPEDGWAGTFHVAARPGPGESPVAVATFFPDPTPLRPGRSAWRLRGMAVDLDRQGQGVGRGLLDEALSILAAAGAEVCWANARDSALGFYQRLGFSVEGDGFELHGKPHHWVIREL